MKAILLMLIFLFSYNVYADVKKVTICWESKLKPPYLMSPKNGELAGIAVELVTKAFTSKNIDMLHVIRPWKRCLLDLNRGKVDIVPNASFKKERTTYALYSEPLYTTHKELYFMKSKFPNARKMTSMEQFHLYVVGGVSGFNYSAYRDQLDIHTQASDRKALIHQLKKNRIDFAIIQKEVLLALYKDTPKALENLASIPALINPVQNYHVLVSKRSVQPEHILNVINASLIDLKKSNVYQQILDKYLGASLVNSTDK